MDHHESKQLQVLANDLYIIHEKIIKTDALIEVVKEKSKRCNKIEKLHKRLLDAHNQLQLKQSISESKVNYCLLNHTPLENELKELRTSFASSETLHYEYVNNAELKYQKVCRELENLKKLSLVKPSITNNKHNKKGSKNMISEELLSKLDALSIELELTKSELENLNKDLIVKNKIINKYEYEKQVLNEKVETLNKQLNKTAFVDRKLVDTKNFYVSEDILSSQYVENNVVMDILPAISEFDNSLPILSDSICAEIVKSSEVELISSYVQTDNSICCNKKTQVKSVSVQTHFTSETNANSLPDSICAKIIKSSEVKFISTYVQTDDSIFCYNKTQFKSIGLQTNFTSITNDYQTNCVQLQTDDLWIQQYLDELQTLRRQTLKTLSTQTNSDDIYNLEDILREMTICYPILSPLDPVLIEGDHISNENETNSIEIGSNDFSCQTDQTKKVESFTITEINKNVSDVISMEIPVMMDFSTQTDQIERVLKPDLNRQFSISMIDFNSQTDQIQYTESNTQTEIKTMVDFTSQTDLNVKSFSSNLISSNTKISQSSFETKLKSRLNTQNSKISKKYKPAKNKLLEHLKHSNLDLRKFLEKYLSEGHGPTFFVSPKILKSSQMNIHNPCKQENPPINVCNCNRKFKQCNTNSYNLNGCQCYHSCNMQRNYPSCTTLQCNISCNGCHGYRNHSHLIKIKHNSNTVILSSDSETEEYKIRNYYKNKFRNKYKAKHNCMCNTFTNKTSFQNKLDTLKREARNSDTDPPNDFCKLRRKRRKYSICSSDSDNDDDNNCPNNISLGEKRRQEFRNPVAEISKNKIIQNSTVSNKKDIASISTEKRIVNEIKPDINNCDFMFNTNSSIVNAQQNNKAKNIQISNRDKITEDLSKNKKINTFLNTNTVKTTKEKSSKVKRLRNLLNKTPLNYNKTNMLTRSMSKNENKEVQYKTNKQQSDISNYKKNKLNLFGFISESDSDGDGNLNKNTEKLKLTRTKSNNKETTTSRTSYKCKKSIPNLHKIQKHVLMKEGEMPNKQNIPEKELIQISTIPLSKLSQCAENLVKPITNHVYKRPERRQTISLGPLSPEQVSYEIVKPKIIPLEQESNTLVKNSNKNINSDSSFISAENAQTKSKSTLESISSPFVYEPPTSRTAKPVLNSNAQTNLLHNKNSAGTKPRFMKKMISDVATSDWNKNLMDTVVASLVNEDLIIVVNLIVNEAAIDHAQQLDKTFTPPAPLMAPSQQKLLVLISRLDNEGLTGLKYNFVNLAEKRILSEKHLSNIQGLTRIYVALSKLEYYIEQVRMFCCNAAYYSGDLFVPIMFIVLTMWGDILPMASADVPLAISLVQIINNKTCHTPGYNTSNLSRLLSDYYGYKRGEKTNEQVMDHLVSLFIENPCSSIFTAIIILFKNLPSKWRFSQIKKHFIPLVDKYRSDQSKAKLISIILTLVNRIKDMFNVGNDMEYINELNICLVKSIANNVEMVNN